MDQLTHRQKLIFYYGLLTAVISGIIAATLLLALTPRTHQAFTELYFPQPEQLPNKARTGTPYSLSYTVQSSENATKAYALESTLTLYELYDETEGLYNCLRPYRKTIYLDWDNRTNITHIYINKTSDLVPDFHTPPDLANPITWDEYHASTGFQRERGNGTFVLYFADANTTKYAITISTVTGEVLFDDTYLGRIALEKDQASIRIHYHDHQLDLSINNLNKTIKDINATNGQFGFESRNVFVKPGITTYKDQPLEIPDRGNIWNYNVDLDYYYGQLSAASKLAAPSKSTTRFYIDERNVSECFDDFSCNYLSPRQAGYTLSNYANITDLLLSLPTYEYGVTFWIRTVAINDTLIPFESFTMTTSYQELFENDSITLLFGEEVAVMTTRDSINFIKRLEGGNITVQKTPLIADNASATVPVEINATHNKITITVGNTTVNYGLQESLLNKSFRTFHHNTYSSVQAITIKNRAEECTIPEPVTYCTLTLGYTAPRRAREPATEQYVTATTTKEPNLLQKLFAPKQRNQTNTAVVPNETFIPAQTYTYNGPLTTIINITNVTFTTNYLALEGPGAVVIAYHTLQGMPAVTITSYPSRNQTVIIYEHDGVYENKTVEKRIEGFTPLALKIGEKTITVSQNRTTIASLRNINVRDGYFSLSTIDLHAELSGTALIYSDVSRRDLPTGTDPCQLREVYQTALRDVRFAMAPGANHTFTDNFTLTSDFDYGKVSIALEGSSNTTEPLEIHAWLVRD